MSTLYEEIIATNADQFKLLYVGSGDDGGLVEASAERRREEEKKIKK